MSSIAVVILNYNGLDLLQTFLPKVIDHSREAKIVVADNGSTDDSLTYLSKNFPAVQVIDLGKNLGFCGGYNAALKKVHADYFVLLNNDVEVTEGWLRPLKDLLDTNESIAAVQPKILSYHKRDEFEYAGAGGGFIDTLGYPFCRGRVFDSLEKDHGQYNDTVPVFWATGACLVVRAKLFRDLGGFDEDFFAHMEEIDLCWRLKRLRYQIFYCGSSTVYHMGGGTLAAAKPAKTYYNFRNGLDLLIKHQKGSQLAWKLPLRVGLDWLAAIRFVFGQPGHAWAVLRAHGYVVAHFGRILSKRERLKQQMGFRVSEIYPRVVIWDYFVRGEKKFPMSNQ